MFLTCNKIPPPDSALQSRKYCTAKGRVEWIDALKIMTMVLVVAGHCTYYTIKTRFGGIDNYSADGYYSLSYRVLQFLTTLIYKFHMPLFMAVSGAVFSLGIGKLNRVRDLAAGKARRLLLPFVAVTTFLVVPLKYFSGYYAGSDHIFRDIICGQYLLLGNSHLWFIVSLFYIFVIFFAMERIRVPKNVAYWLVLTVVSWAGTFLLRYGDLGGIPGMLKHLLFFAAGFSTFEYWNRRQPMPVMLQGLSWLGFVLFVMSTNYLLTHSHSLILKSAVIFPCRTLAAFWGCANMVHMAKSFLHSGFMKSRLCAFAGRYTYELYLYSDPFNYLLIAMLMGLFGQAVFTDSLCSGLAFFIRFFGTLLSAAAVIFLWDICIMRRLFACKNRI